MLKNLTVFSIPHLNAGFEAYSLALVETGLSSSMKKDLLDTGKSQV